MQLWLDSADIEEIKEASPFIDGITTNPTLIKEALEHLHFKEFNMNVYIDEIIKILFDRPINLEPSSIVPETMVEQAKILYRKYRKNNVIIKIPCTYLNVIHELSHMPINATLVMSPTQAVLASKAGARYVSPFIGRMDDYDGSGLSLLSNIIKMFRVNKIETKIIAASIRNYNHAKESLLLGSDIVTVPFKVLERMINHPKTNEGINRFDNDSVKEYKEIFDENSKI